MYHKILGIDLAKSVFQLCLLNGNHVVFNKKMTRNRLLAQSRLFYMDVPEYSTFFSDSVRG
ncbi:hypothetical protein ACNFJN_05490 [Xenorhabdus budapestensis]|uniref:hypothetical protein n=1 Tax=Xenorhabdus budapestensis TaxID=290110 RepID=UPI003A8C4365